jgi:hypothetical protein
MFEKINRRLGAATLLKEIMMKLIKDEFELLFKDYPLYSQGNKNDPIIIVKFFTQLGSATWYLTKYCSKQKLAFGYVCDYGTGDLEYYYRRIRIYVIPWSNH